MRVGGRRWHGTVLCDEHLWRRTTANDYGRLLEVLSELNGRLWHRLRAHDDTEWHHTIRAILLRHLRVL